MRKLLGIFTILLLLPLLAFSAPTNKGWIGDDFFVPGYILVGDSVVASFAFIDDSLYAKTARIDTLSVDSLSVNNFSTDSLWANWAQIDKLTDGTATLEGGDLTGLDSLQVSKVGAFTIYGQVSGNQQNITDVNELTADSIAVARLDADSSFLGILGESIDGNQKNITDLNKVVSDTLNDGTANLVGGDWTGATYNGLTIVAGSNTFDLSNGTGSLNIAAGKTLNIDMDLTIDGTKTTITGVTQANVLTLNEGFTIGGGYTGTLTYSVASKTATVEDNATISQDYTSDANPTFDYVINSNETAVASAISTDHSAYYSYDDGSNVHIAALIDDNGTESTEYLASTQDVLNRGIDRTLWLTTDDYVEVGDDPDLDFGTGDFAIRILDVIPYDVSGTEYLINKEAGGVGYGLYITDDDLYIRFDDNTTDVSAIIGTAVFTAGVAHDIFVNFDRSGNATAFINGRKVGTVAISTASLTLSNAGALRIGCTTAGASFFAGEIGEWNVFNKIYDETDVIDLAIIEGGAVPWLYQGASQTDIVSGWDFTVGWIEGTATINDATSFTTTAENGGIFKTYLKVGKKYRWIISTSTDAGIVDLKLRHSTLFSTQNIGTGSGTYEFTAEGDQLLIRGSDNGATVTVASQLITQIGCVGDWNPRGIASGTWYDASGNELDGTISGAVPVNPYVSAYYHNAEADATGIPEINYKDSSSPADEDVIKQRDGYANDSAGNRDNFTSTREIVSDATATTEDGRIEHWVMVNGTLTKIVTYDATGATIVGNVAATTYESTVTAAELAYVGDVTSLIQAQLDARCLESVFGTAIGAGLTLDATTLKTHAALQSIAGLAETNGGIAYGTADNTYAWLAAGDAGKFLQANGAAAPTWESVVDVYYGEMYLNNNGVATTIETANIPIMVRNFTTGSVNGFTYDAGSTSDISAYADYSGTVAGTVLATTTSTATLATGDEVSIRGSTSYNDVFTVTVVDATHFYFTDTWVADDGASDWDEGSYLLADAGSGGLYRIIYNLSCSEGGAAGSNVITDVYINATPCGKCISKRKFANNDYGSVGGTSIETIAAGDKIYITLQSDGVNAITAQYGNISISRL